MTLPETGEHPDGKVLTPQATNGATQQTPEKAVNGNGTQSKLFSGERDPETGLVNQWHSQPRKIRIIHIGAGATGLLTAYKMRKQLQDYELVCYEKNDTIGGTWLESMDLLKFAHQL